MTNKTKKTNNTTPLYKM